MASISLVELHVAELFAKSCAAVGREVPKTEAECTEFAAACVDGFKVKAQLLAKVDLMARPHADYLWLLAGLTGFSTWHALVTYAKRFPTLERAARLTNPQSFSLSIGLWLFKRTDALAESFVSRFLTTFRRGLRILGDDDEVAGRLASLIFFNQDLPDEELAGYSVGKVLHRFTGIEGWTPSTYVCLLLSRYPVKDGRQVSWPPLTAVKASQLSRMPLANPGTEDGFGRPGWEHCVADMQPQLSFVTHPNPQARARAEASATSLSSRMSCRPVVEQQLKELADTTVLDAITRREHSSGFFKPAYLGSPDELALTLAKELHYRQETLTQVVFKEPVGSHYLSIFRHQCHCGDPRTGRCYSAEAMFHSKDGHLVAQVGLALVNLSELCDVPKMVSCLDHTNDTDIQTLAVSLIEAIKAGQITGFDWRRTLLVRDWQVRRQDRGHGLGRALLKEACKRAFKGLASPLVVASRPWPMQLLDRCAEAAPGIPEIEGPARNLERYWKSDLVQAALPSSVRSTIEAHYFPAMHECRDHSRELAFIGMCHHEASLLGQR